MFVPKRPTDMKSSFVSGKGSAPNRHQAITWANDDTVHRGICAIVPQK